MTARDAGAGPTGRVLLVRCDCGFEVRGTADEVVDAMQAHAKDVHNMSATREQVLERARPA
jgi:predicted small metal-binding protein